jgi:hypothetical protein
MFTRFDSQSGEGLGTCCGYDGIQRPATLSHNLAGTTGDYAITLTRNAAGQIASVTRANDPFAWGGHYAVNRAYTANGLNQYSAAGGATFGYDPNGNLTSDGTHSYVYDIENRLVSASGGGASATLDYDPLDCGDSALN